MIRLGFTRVSLFSITTFYLLVCVCVDTTAVCVCQCVRESECVRMSVFASECVYVCTCVIKIADTVLFISFCFHYRSPVSCR